MSSEPGPVIYWFRQDLRLADLPGLAAAAAEGGIIPCYVHDDHSPGEWTAGGASRWWLHHSLAALDGDLRERGSKLLILRGDSVDAILSRVEARLREDQAGAALLEAQSLPDSARAEMAGWIALLAERAGAQDALKEVRDSVRTTN